MAARSKARKRAVDILFESDLRGVDPLDTLTSWKDRDDPPVPEHAERLVRLVAERRSVIDAVITDRLVGWDFARLSPVDRAVLRLATAEVLWVDDVPDAVAVDEAVELAKSLSTDEAGGFVNGVLGRVVADKPALVAATAAAEREGWAAAAGASDGGDGAPGVGVEDAPRDEPLGELAGRLVVDDGE